MEGGVNLSTYQTSYELRVRLRTMYGLCETLQITQPRRDRYAAELSAKNPHQIYYLSLFVLNKKQLFPSHFRKHWIINFLSLNTNISE